MTMRHPSACLRCVQRPLAVFAATTLAIGLAVEAAVLCAAAAYSCGIFGFAGGVASSLQGPAHLATRVLHHGERGGRAGGPMQACLGRPSKRSASFDAPAPSPAAGLCMTGALASAPLRGAAVALGVLGLLRKLALPPRRPVVHRHRLHRIQTGTLQ